MFNTALTSILMQFPNNTFGTHLYLHFSSASKWLPNHQQWQRPRNGYDPHDERISSHLHLKYNWHSVNDNMYRTTPCSHGNFASTAQLRIKYKKRDLKVSLPILKIQHLAQMVDQVQTEGIFCGDFLKDRTRFARLTTQTNSCKCKRRTKNTSQQNRTFSLARRMQLA